MYLFVLYFSLSFFRYVVRSCFLRSVGLSFVRYFAMCIYFARSLFSLRYLCRSFLRYFFLSLVRSLIL